MDDYLQRQICARIKQARKAAGLTQEDMANLLSVTTRAYQNYERDRVPFRSLGKIATLTAVSQEWLLRGELQETESPGLLRDVASGVAELERSSEHVLQQLDDVLARLARIEGWLSPSEEHRPQNPL